jgi:hypothetical protein
MALPTVDTASRFGGFTDLATASHTCSGTNRLLHVFTFNRDAGAGDVTGVTYNSVAMTLVSTALAVDVSWMRVWQLVAPASGLNTVEVTLSGFRTVEVQCISYSGVNQSMPIGLFNTPFTTTTLSPSDSLTLTADQLGVRFCGQQLAGGGTESFVATGTDSTERTDGYNTPQYASIATQTGVGSITGGFTFSSSYTDYTGMLAVPVNGITGGGGGATIRRNGFVRAARR